MAETMFHITKNNHIMLARFLDDYKLSKREKVGQCSQVYLKAVCVNLLHFFHLTLPFGFCMPLLSSTVLCCY